MTTRRSHHGSHPVSSLALRFKNKFRSANGKQYTETREIQSPKDGSSKIAIIEKDEKGLEAAKQSDASELRHDFTLQETKRFDNRDRDQTLTSQAGVTEPVGEAETNVIQEKTKKWFDAVDLEISTELSALRLHVSDIKIKLPDSSSEDEDLKTLIGYANSPPVTIRDGRRSIEMLQMYLQTRQQKEDDEKLVLEQKRQAKASQRGAASARLHGLMDRLSTQMTKVFEFVLTVLQGGAFILQATAFLASEITFQTHYEVAIKAIMLFVTAYEKSKELTEDVVTMFDQIGAYGEEMETLQEVVRSAQMSRAINKLFVSSVTLIISAGSYMNHGTLSKMAKYLGGGNDRLNGLIKAVKNDYSELSRTLNFAHVMMTLSSHENIKGIGTNVERLMQQLTLLNDATSPEMSKQIQVVFDHSGFQADLHVQSLRAELFDGAYEPIEEMTFNDCERVFLSPADRWPRQLRGFSPSITHNGRSVAGKQSLHAHRPLIWISGHASRRNVSWVSTFSVDLISHFRELGFFDLAYIFCKRGRGQRYTPTSLMKGLIIQILECHPSVAVKNVRRLSKHRFREVGRMERDAQERQRTGHVVWALLEDLLRLIEIAPEFQTRTVLLLIDRLDLCVSEEGFSVLNDLIPRLQAVSEKITRIQVMVTTARLSPLGIPSLRKGSEAVQAYGKKRHG